MGRKIIAAGGSTPGISFTPAQRHRLAKHLQIMFKLDYRRADEMALAILAGGVSGNPLGAVLQDGTAPLLAAWNAGAFIITAGGFVGTTLNGRNIATDQAKLDTAAANATAAGSAASAASAAAAAAQGTANTANTAAGTAQTAATAAQATANAALPKAGGQMSGDITMAGAQLVDGRDVSADGAILDTIKTRYIGQNLQTGTAYTLVLTDAGKMVEMNNAAINTLTIPANVAVAFPVDTRIDVCQGGAGQTTIAITTDTLNPATARKIPAQWGIISLWKKSATVWVMAGGTA